MNDGITSKLTRSRGIWLSAPVWFMLVLTFALALLVDNRPLPDGPAKYVMSLVADHVPSIENYAKVSAFPHVTRVVFVVVWLLVPVYAVIFSYSLLAMPLSPVRLEFWRRHRLFMAFAVMLVIPAVLVFCVFKLGITNFPEEGGRMGERIARAIANSREMLAVGASVIGVFISFMVALFIFWMKLLPTLFKSRNQS